MLVLCLVIGGGCKKPASTCSFSGSDAGTYTQTDVNGAVIGTADALDWTNDNNWNTCENNLFSATDSFSYQDLTVTSVGGVMAFPNPFIRNLDITANVNGKTIVKSVIVDENFITVSQFANSMDSGKHVWQYQFTQIDTTKKYRMYYRFYGLNKSVVYQGHGDLRVTN